MSLYYVEIGCSLVSDTEEARREARGRLAVVPEPEDETLSKVLKALRASHVKNLERRLVFINAFAGELTSIPTLDDLVAKWFHPKVTSKLIWAQLDTWQNW